MSAPAVNVSVPFEEIQRAVLALPVAEQAKLARELAASLELADEAAWEAEPGNLEALEQARREADAGNSITLEQYMEERRRTGG
jgi:hypothetical protein